MRKQIIPIAITIPKYLMILSRVIIEICKAGRPGNYVFSLDFVFRVYSSDVAEHGGKIKLYIVD